MGKAKWSEMTMVNQKRFKCLVKMYIPLIKDNSKQYGLKYFSYYIVREEVQIDSYPKEVPLFCQNID